jgi:hypothetical protein
MKRTYEFWEPVNNLPTVWPARMTRSHRSWNNESLVELHQSRRYRAGALLYRGCTAILGCLISLRGIAVFLEGLTPSKKPVMLWRPFDARDNQEAPHRPFRRRSDRALIRVIAFLLFSKRILVALPFQSCCNHYV